MLFKLFAYLCILSIGMLLPINYFGGNGQQGINALTLKNVKRGSNLLWGHIVYAMLFVSIVLYYIMRELQVYVKLRRRYLRTDNHSKKNKSRTILVNNIPKPMMDRIKLESLFSAFPEGVREVYLDRDVREIERVIKERDRLQNKFEKIMTRLAIQHCKERKRSDKRNSKQGPQYDQPPDDMQLPTYTSVEGQGRLGPDEYWKELLPKDYESKAILEGLLRNIEEQSRKFVSLRLEFNMAHNKQCKDEWEAFLKRNVVNISKKIDKYGEKCQELTEKINQIEKDEYWQTGDSEVNSNRIKYLTIRRENYSKLVKSCIDEKTKYEDLCKKNGVLIAGIKEDKAGNELTFSQWCRQHYNKVAGLISKRLQIEAKIGIDNRFKKRKTAFIEFNSQISAHMAAQTLLYSKPFSMNPKALEVQYDDIIWENLNISSWSRNLRFLFSMLITLLICCSWLTMTMFVTSLASLENIETILGNKKDIIKSLSPSVISAIQGTIPSLFTTILMIVLPIFLRILMTFEGKALKSEIELSLMYRYYIFLVINVFFSAVISSSFFAFLSQLKTTGAWENLINTLIPGAYVYFATYIILQGWVGSAREILQIPPLFFRHFLPWFFSDTPRSREEAIELAEFEWGTSIPNHTLIFLIGATYSGFAPIINVLVASYYGLFYIVYRYQFLYVYDEKKFSAGGLSFPRAVMQMYIGIYIFEVVFFVQMVSASTFNLSGVLRVIAIIIIIFGTVVTHLVTVSTYFPLIKYLPVSSFNTDLENDDNFMESHIRRFTRKILETIKVKRNKPKNIFDDGYEEDKKDAESCETNSLVGGDSQVSISDAKSKDSLSPNEEIRYKNGYYHPSLKEDSEVKFWLPRDDYGTCIKLFNILQGAMPNPRFSLETAGAYINEKLQVVLDKENRSNANVNATNPNNIENLYNS
ncbi:hypothetical protein H4219_000714 [Mycoemilia scoparia]|uniref:DUF221-domain-containing protein n=1 Tax=Mycoemilia scoparia TaxID=417184 RepID=A0A9W8A8L0_9FUNG|nr:hypothetical protein H4219_000714 [Mycoemilia scoparia]